MSEIKASEQMLKICDWKKLELNGVDNILEFDDSVLSLETNRGRIYVEGEGLKIEALSESGEILINGTIYGIYVSADKATKKGFFGKIFAK